MFSNPDSMLLRIIHRQQAEHAHRTTRGRTKADRVFAAAYQNALTDVLFELEDCMRGEGHADKENDN